MLVECAVSQMEVTGYRQALKNLLGTLLNIIILWTNINPSNRSIFHTCFMGTENSSNETRGRAKELAELIGAYHVDLNMDACVKAVSDLFIFVTNKRPRFTVHGGSKTENLALQNIQV